MTDYFKDVVQASIKRYAERERLENKCFFLEGTFNTYRDKDIVAKKTDGEGTADPTPLYAMHLTDCPFEDRYKLDHWLAQAFEGGLHTHYIWWRLAKDSSDVFAVSRLLIPAVDHLYHERFFRHGNGSADAEREANS